ncbi:MAG: hypothetical protein EKK57_04815 [Proteobacteria bacterium]|nr:MAG: hypothetical protein EKK57_04815 [Pseudomonadota bacterium]
MHGFKLVDCEYFVKEKLMHPLIERCFTLYRQFNDAYCIRITYDVYGINFAISIFYVDDKYFINTFLDNFITSFAVILAETEKYNRILNELTPTKIEILYKNRNKISEKIDVTDKILPL